MKALNSLNLNFSGRRVFILGGGPSLLNFDYSILDNELTIGTNKTILRYSPTINLAQDINFQNLIFHKKTKDSVILQFKWRRYSGIKVLVKHQSRKVLTVEQHKAMPPGKPRNYMIDGDYYFITEGTREKIYQNLENNELYISSNVGLTAILLAVALGSSDIYLLGIDLKNSNNRTHWHNGYRDQSPIKMESVYPIFWQDFRDMKPKFDKLNINITNCNPDSALNLFPKKKLEEVLCGSK